MTEDTMAVGDLVDHVALLLAGVPKERRTECAVRLLAEYNTLLAERWPARAAEREHFLVQFFALLQMRMGELAMSGGAGGTA